MVDWAPSLFYLLEDFVGELLRSLGCHTEPQPLVGNGRADILATTPQGDRFYVEATVVKPRQFSEPRATEEDVCQKLNRMCEDNSHYWFYATSSGELYQNLPSKKLVLIKEWVETLTAIYPAPSTKTFIYSSGTPPPDEDSPSSKWIVQIRALPRSVASIGVYAPMIVGFGRGGEVDSVSPLIRAARAKVKQHKNVSEPLLLAMNDVADFPSGRIDISNALFGWEQSAETGVSLITPPSESARLPSL